MQEGVSKKRLGQRIIAVALACSFAIGTFESRAKAITLETVTAIVTIGELVYRAAQLGVNCWDLYKDLTSPDDYDSAYSDYLTTLDSTTITNSDIAFVPSMASFDASVLGSYAISYVDNLPISFSFISAANTSSGYGGYTFSKSLKFYTVPFSVAETDNYIIDMGTVTRSVYSSSYCRPFLQCSADGGETWTSVLSSSGNSLYDNYSVTDTLITSYSGFGDYRCVAKTTTRQLVVGNLYRFGWDWSYQYSGSSTSVGLQFTINFDVLPSVYRSGVTTVEESTRPSGLSTVINQYNTQNISTGGSYTNFYVGTVDANGDVVDIYDFDIFDESTMTITNPASGDTWTATAWEYDYETRSYYCTLEDDQYCRITYGDEYVTIIYPDEDGVYHEQYYYYVTAEYTATSGTTCDHVYTSETTTLPSCTESGWRTYTCALCGYSYETSVPATGHTWEETETVETEYNDNGDVTKLGYTIYTCADCGETYTAYMQDGQPTGPPDSSGSSSGSTSSGGTGIWDSIKNAVSNAIGDLVEAAIDLVTAVIKGTLSLATDMLSFFFDFLGDTVTSGVGSFFDSFSDDSVIGFFQRENEDGTTTTTLPEDMASGMSSIAGLFTSLPAELQAVLTYGLALLFLIAAFKIVL